MLPSPGQFKPVPVHLCIPQKGPARRFYLLFVFLAPLLLLPDAGYPPRSAGTALPEQAVPQLVGGESVVTMLSPTPRLKHNRK